MKIKKAYLISHTHTDFGYTDHVNSVLMTHRRIFDRVLDVCEESYDARSGTQHRWTAELASTVLDYLRTTSTKNVDRFVALNHADRIAVGAMSYNNTPLVSKPLAQRMLQDVDALRNEFDIKVNSAMQCDVNGLGQMWIKMLQDKGIKFLSFHQNPHRGYLGDAVPAVWKWQSTAGDEMLVHQGVHYYHGAHMQIARPGLQNRELFMDMMHRFEQAPGWPFDFAAFNITNLANSDNAYPEPFLPQAIQEWNDAGEIPIEVVSLDGLNKILTEAAIAHSESIPTYRGEWSDAWADGVASMPLATAAARSAERMLPILQGLAKQHAGKDNLDMLTRNLGLYNEHTFTAYSAVIEPDSVFPIMQETNKSNFAFTSLAEALRLTANFSRQWAGEITQSEVEGGVKYANRAHPQQSPDEHTYVVSNPTDIEMNLYWPVPVDRGAGLRQGMPQALDEDMYFPNIDLDAPVRVPDFCAPSGNFMLQTTLAPRATILLKPSKPDLSSLVSSGITIENEYYRVTVSNETGALESWYDKELDQELAADNGRSFITELQTLQAGYTRHDLYVPPYWEGSDRTTHPSEGEMLQSEVGNFSVGESCINNNAVEINVRREFSTGAWVETRYQLFPGKKELHVRGLQNTNHDIQALALNWFLYFNQAPKRIWLDSGMGFIDAVKDHLPFSCTRWQTVQRGLVYENNDHAIVISAPDTPLFQPAGPWATDPYDTPQNPKGGTFWAINNHWDTNFPVESRYTAPARFILSSSSEHDLSSAMNFCTRTQAAPIIVRAPYAERLAD